MQSAIIAALNMIGKAFYDASGPHFIAFMEKTSAYVRQKVVESITEFDDKLFLPLLDKLDAKLTTAPGKDVLYVFLDVLSVAYECVPQIGKELVIATMNEAKEYVASTENDFDDAIVNPLADFVLARLS